MVCGVTLVCLDDVYNYIVPAYLLTHLELTQVNNLSIALSIIHQLHHDIIKI